MISFHEPTIDDRAWIHPILYAAERPGADYTFNNMYFWSEYYGRVGLAEGFLTQHKRHHGKNIYIFPVGQGDVQAALDAIFHDAHERGGGLRFRGVTDETRRLLEELYPGEFHFEPYRAAYDYVYDIEVLCELRGKKLQAKRNHCNRFIADHPDWHTESLTEALVPQCLAFLDLWYEDREMTPPLRVERAAVTRALHSYHKLEMDGLLLYDAERLLAFSMGTRMNASYYDVNFEKALADVDGAYAMINREFSRMIASRYPDIKYLNREDDMGLEGLRRAKESYHPTLLLEKYNAVFVQEEL